MLVARPSEVDTRKARLGVQLISAASGVPGSSFILDFRRLFTHLECDAVGISGL